MAKRDMKIVIKIDHVNKGRRESREIFRGIKSEKTFKSKKTYSRKKKENGRSE